ncbi:hypothetical protein RMCBS344292_02204 [Rhizopus microsporus]|nr:hypothetical protein RMCBS344292_02204 [Rhizopus microsporus]
MTSPFLDPELLLFAMDPKYPPGSDLISKLVLRNSDVVEMITITLIGPNAASLYLPRPTEWAGGSKSDTVYVANVSSTSLPPILIEVQHTITTEFIDRLINYSLSVKKCFKAKPTSKLSRFLVDTLDPWQIIKVLDLKMGLSLAQT